MHVFLPLNDKAKIPNICFEYFVFSERKLVKAYNATLKGKGENEKEK